jgi:hypothetical protein
MKTFYRILEVATEYEPSLLRTLLDCSSELPGAYKTSLVDGFFTVCAQLPGKYAHEAAAKLARQIFEGAGVEVLYIVTHIQA